jgi:hypothetical protein
MKNARALLAAAAACGLAATAHGAVVINASAVPFVDISATGTSVGAIGDDTEFNITGAALTGAGFNGNGLLAGGVSIRVGNNGGVFWGNAAADAFANATEVGAINRKDFPTMPAGNSNFGDPTGNGGLGPRQMLAVLWDDNTPGSGASTKWQVVGNDLIVQWTNEDHFNATGAGVITYEMIVHGGVTIASGNSLVDFVYQDTLYAANQYQDDGGSATIGYKNWGINANANDVEFGNGGGGSNTSLADPAFGDPTMMPKVAGYLAANNPNLPHSVSISGQGGGVVPEPTSLGLLAVLPLGALARRRRGA